MMNNSGDLTGKILGTCTLERLVGQGGMGAVYLARQSRPSRSVAVKVLLPRIRMSSAVYQAFLARFQREADLIARLEHMNIMPIYEYGEQDGITYLVMPYLPGGNLRDVLAEHGALSLHVTLSYIEQAASALDYAHAHGVIHRDIKPSNFLLHPDGRLILADFGIARMMNDESSTIGATLTSTGMLLGTPEYMAPEMARGEPIDARADIYELGIVLFQMLSGHVPFKGNTPLAVVVKQLEEPLPPLYLLNPAIPSVVDKAVQMATAKRREDRYRSAGELAQALRLAISSPDYPSEAWARNASTLLSSQPGVPPPPPPDQGMLPPIGIGQAINFPPASTSDRSRGASPLSTPVTPGAYISPVTPYPGPMRTQEPRSGLRPWLLVAIVLLLIVLTLGGVFIGFHLGRTPAPLPPAASIPNPTSGATVVPTSVPPTPVPPTPVPPTPTPSPAQQAQAVVQQYYNDINNADYQSAYNLWGSSYQNSHSYTSFANGFANTVHDTISFGTITPLSDGTVQVSITLQAVENNSSGGTTTSTFQGYYKVGQENGSWKLLSSNIVKTG
jgi:serine/threonine-protein kinase